MLRCQRNTLCERLLEFGELNHEGSHTDLIDRLVASILERQSMDRENSTSVATVQPDVNASLQDLQRRLRLTQETIDEIKKNGFLDVEDMSTHIRTFGDLQQVVSLKRDQLAIRNDLPHLKILSTSATAVDVNHPVQQNERPINQQAAGSGPVQNRLGPLRREETFDSGESETEDFSPEIFVNQNSFRKLRTSYHNHLRSFMHEHMPLKEGEEKFNHFT